MQDYIITKSAHRIDAITTSAIILIGILAIYMPIFAQYADVTPERSGAKISDSADLANSGWDSFESEYFTVMYEPGVNINRVERKVKSGYFFAGGPRPSSFDSLEERLAYRLDTLFEKAKELLDMRPRKMHVKIKIFKNRRALNEEYRRIFGQKRDMISFYIYAKDTIFTNAEDISGPVIIHEMGHAIVDHYFTVRPPEKIKELLATFVNTHMDD